MKIWNFGIVGAGLIAEFHAKAIRDLPNARLVGFCDTVFDRAKLLSEKYNCKFYDNCEQMVSDAEIDIITIATPSGMHMDPVVAAAKADKHAICEKPLEITADHMTAMIDAHKKSGTRLGCIFQERFCDALIPLREAIMNHRFEKITFAGAFIPWWRKSEYYKDSWHGTWEFDGGGSLMNQSIHFIDILIDMMGPVESVMAYADALGHEIETEDTAVVSIRFKNKALGLIYGTTASYPGQVARIEITGTKGTAIYNGGSYSFWQFVPELPEDNHIQEQFGKNGTLGGASDPAGISHILHVRNFAAFIDAVEHNTPFVLDPEHGRKAVDLVLAIYKSVRTGNEVIL